MVRIMGLPLEAMVAKWLERRPNVYLFSRSSNVCVAEIGSLQEGVWNWQI